MAALGTGLGILALVVGAIVAFVIIVLLIYASRYKKVPPDSAMVVGV